jgi:GNAT superfamily N-acetyltransferase
MNIIKSIEENFSATGRYWGSFNSSFTKTKIISAMSTGIPTADLNWVWNEKPLTMESAGEISSIKNNYQQSGLPFWWWVYPGGQSPLTKTILEGAGLHFLTAIPCLAADLSMPTVKTCSSSAITVSLVKNNKDLSRWEEVSFAGFDMDGSEQIQYHNFVDSFNITAASPQKLFLAYFEEKPVATALLFFHKETAGIYFVSTLPAYRRRGIGLALTQGSMQYARLAGYKYSILQSAAAGLRVYKQAGFKEQCRADVYSLETSQ